MQKMIGIYTDEFVDYRDYKEASKNLQFNANLLLFFHHTDMLLEELCALRRLQPFPWGSSLRSVHYKRRAVNAGIFFFFVLFFVCFKSITNINTAHITRL